MPMPTSDDPVLWLHELVEEGRAGELHLSPWLISFVEGALETYAERLVESLLADVSAASTG